VAHRPPRTSGNPCLAHRGDRQTTSVTLIFLVLTILFGSALSGTVFSQSDPTASHPTSNSVISVALSSDPSFPSGWTLSNRTINWTNYSLPYFPGTRYFFGPSSIFDSPVIAADPATGALTAYYVNASSQLLAYTLKSGGVVTLGIWPTNLSDDDSPSMVQGFQNSSGNVTTLFEIGVTSSGFVEVAWYSLLNGSYRFANTTIFGGTLAENVGVGATSTDGWIYWTDLAMARLDFFNVYSGQLVRSNWSALFGWNSPVFVPTADQIVEDANDASNHSIEIRAANLTFPGGTPTVGVRTLWAGPFPFIIDVDANNMPYFFSQTSSGTILWGLGANSGRNGTYHVLELELQLDLSRDSVVSVIDVGMVGATDEAAFAFWDQSGYFLNGFDGGAKNGSEANNQAPFLDPLARSVIEANNSAWLNRFLSTQNFAFGLGPWVNSWEFIGPPSGWENAVLYGSKTNISCDGTCTLLLYSTPGPRTGSLAGPPPSPYNLTSNSTSTSIRWSWKQSSPNPITNDTVILFNGPDCSSFLASDGTGGPAESFTDSGLVAGGAWYSAEVRAWVGPQASGPSECLNASTSPSRTGPSEYIDPDLPIVIEVLAALAFGVFVGYRYFEQRRSRRRRKGRRIEPDSPRSGDPPAPRRRLASQYDPFAMVGRGLGGGSASSMRGEAGHSGPPSGRAMKSPPSEVSETPTSTSTNVSTPSGRASAASR
jgi:hypothetical protein